MLSVYSVSLQRHTLDGMFFGFFQHTKAVYWLGIKCNGPFMVFQLQIAKGQNFENGGFYQIDFVELELLDKNTSPICQGIPETNWK